MNPKIKKTVRKAFIAIYRPYIIRKEKFIATRMWRRGVQETIKAYKEVNGPRFYMWFDRSTFSFMPIVYEYRPKGDAIAMKYLQATHKIRAKRRMTVEDMKRECFYYTPSRWGAIGCESDNQLRLKKYNEWLAYYMTKLSEPMRKLRQFQP